MSDNYYITNNNNLKVIQLVCYVISNKVIFEC